MFRLKGILSDRIYKSRLAFVGCGASSYLIEKVSRLSPKELLLVDGDTVEESNIERTSFFPDQIGFKKVEALKDNIRRINSKVKVKCIKDFLTESNVSLLRNSDIVVCGVDNFETKILLNKFCYPAGIPVVYVSFHRRIEGGRIIWTDPADNSPCYECIDAVNCDRFRKGEVLNLKSEPGCLADAQLIDSIAFKVILALIEKGVETSYGRFYEKIKGKNEVIIQTLPDYAFGNMLFNAIFSEVEEKEREEIRQILGVNFIAFLNCEKRKECKICSL